LMMSCASPTLTAPSPLRSHRLAAMMTVESFADALAEPPPATATLFTCGDAALAATFTVTVIGGKLAPPLRASLRVHELPAQVHPAPAIETSVRPAGTVSVTVTAPAVGGDPAAFDTVTV